MGLSPATYNKCIHKKDLADTLIIDRAVASVIIKVLGHQHQWFPGVSQVVTM